MNALSWNLQNTYAQLPEKFYTKLNPTPVKSPKIVITNKSLAKELGLNVDTLSEHELAQLFSGNKVPEDFTPLAQAYAGHQFGHFTFLGDGRAHLIGEHLTPDKQLVDIQLKGSGPTPYSRGGDGRAAIGPMLREYIISEGMHALGIPTTRSLAVVTTGETVYRETPLHGAILCRVAQSHLRIGTFEYFAAKQDTDAIKQLADYAVHRHYPELINSETRYIDLLTAVMDRQIQLIVNWMRVGFIHGVMNTDNMAISGETIDYGPCAFMDQYHPDTVFSSIDRNGRYAYANQPSIALWNLTRFAETLVPVISEDSEKAIPAATEILETFEQKFETSWLKMMRKKLGLISDNPGDKTLITELLNWMQESKADFTNYFYSLTSELTSKKPNVNNAQTNPWITRWLERLSQENKPTEEIIELMRIANPAVIPRNHKVEEALKAAEEGGIEPAHQLIKAITNPNKVNNDYMVPMPPEQGEYKTFCGT